MKNNELRVIFDPSFLANSEILGNTITISHYYLEDVRSSFNNIDSLLDFKYQGINRYNSKPIDVIGYWDCDRKELKIHISLQKFAYSNKVIETRTSEDPEIFEYEDVDSFGIHDGDGLIRVIRFTYNDSENTAFILTSDIINSGTEGIVLNPIKCDQDKIIITVGFPETTQANIKVKKVEKDTAFLEGPGTFRGVNIFRETNEESIVSKHSALKYLGSIVSEIELDKKDVPYIDSSGQFIYRRNKFRVYTSLEIFCNGLMHNIRPKTRASLNINGGIIRIYGTLEYLEYEIRNFEFVYVGSGTEALDGLPDSRLILTQHEGGLKNPTIENKFYIKYGENEGQPDPSVLVKAQVDFWNPFTQEVKTLESSNIRLTQEENVISQWEVIYRSSQYTENFIPVYLFPWESGYKHSFIIRTTLPDLRIEEDFIMEYSDPILENYFTIDIERIPNRIYPITDYRVNIVSIESNLDPVKWFPIINEESELRIAALRLKDYDYTESFYYVQSPKSNSLELHDIDNNLVEEIILEYNQEQAVFYPVAPEARAPEELGLKNSWKIIDYDHEFLSFESDHGALNTADNLENKLLLFSNDISESTEDLNLGKIIVGRIKESEIESTFTDWRSIIGLYTITIPVSKRGIIGTLNVPDSIILEEINLYPIRVISNGPFACCCIDESEDYCFFDPITNTVTGLNHYYSSNFNSVGGIDVYLALHDTTLVGSEPFADNKILFTVTNTEPNWEENYLDLFNDPSNLSTCMIYRRGVQNPRLDYVDPTDSYIFLDSYTPTPIRFLSSETPVVNRLITLDDYTDQHNSFYNSMSLDNSSLAPIFSVMDNYKYHQQYIQNPNPISGYYPISPCCIYSVNSYNYRNASLRFYLFRKAIGPSFYRSDSIGSNNNIMYVSATPETTYITINSVYEIFRDEIEITLNNEGAFELSTFEHFVRDYSDYRHQYRLGLNIRVSNNGGQRPLGEIFLVSRIYDLVNFTSSDSINTIPYIDLTQDEIDRIVPPATMKISVIQLSSSDGSGNPDEINVIGNRSSAVSSSGETRYFKIISDIPILEPNITNVVGSGVEITDKSTEGFSINIPSIVEGYESIVPSESDSYTNYTSKKTISFNLIINEDQDPPSISPYQESFIFKQEGISKGLIFALPSETPKLYLGLNSISYTVDSRTTSINIFLGVFNVVNRISNGVIGTTSGINIETQNSYVFLPGNCIYNLNNWGPTVRLEFPQNSSERIVERVFTITYNDNELVHKITLTIKQVSGTGNIICNDSAYFLSCGDCIESSDYSNNLGLFTFETDIDIRTLSLDIPSSLLESYSFISIGTSGNGGNYKTYKAQIKLKPNLKNSIIKNQIFSFLKNGERIKNVYINQGYYSLMLCKPGYSDVGVFSGGTLGSLENLIEVPSRDNIEIGERRLFNLVAYRQEPIPETGEFTERQEIVFPYVEDLLYVDSYTWTKLESSTFSTTDTDNNDVDDDSNSDIENSVDDRTSTTSSSGKYLREYRSEIFPYDLNVDNSQYPFLENIYIVNPRYYTTEIPIKVNVTVLANYPLSDPLYQIYKRITTHSYTIYLLKRAQEV